jgi:hypothetical protein
VCKNRAQEGFVVRTGAAGCSIALVQHVLTCPEVTQPPTRASAPRRAAPDGPAKLRELRGRQKRPGPANRTMTPGTRGDMDSRPRG